MKKILRALLVSGLVCLVLTVATVGYFSSQVSASTNTITTGKLHMAIDSILPGENKGYTVVSDDNGEVKELASLPPITGLLPGQTHSIYLSLRNNDSLGFDYRAHFTGSWGDPQLDAQNMMSVSQVHRIALGYCGGDHDCETLSNWGASTYSTIQWGNDTYFGSLGPITSSSGSNYFGSPDAVSNNIDTLMPGESSLFKVDFTLSPDASNEFQGKTFTYGITAQSKQFESSKY